MIGSIEIGVVITNEQLHLLKIFNVSKQDVSFRGGVGNVFWLWAGMTYCRSEVGR